MHTPLNSVLKFTLVSLSLYGLWACQYDLGERTLITEGAATVVVERNMVAIDASTETAGSCIALPDTWPEPTAVEITGTAQVEGATQSFATTPIRYANGETAINAHLQMNGYVWFCYIDETREYAYSETEETWEVIHADSGKIQYTLTPNSDHGLVFTTIGLEDGGNEERPYDYYYNQMASHQVLKNNSATTHFEKIPNTFSQEGYNPVNDGLQVFEHNDSIYFVGTQGKALVTQMDGSYEARDVPDDSQIYLLNNHFIAFKEVYETETHTVASSEIRHSTDMIVWSEAIDVSILNNVYSHTLSYDTQKGLYVVLNPATTQGQDKIYFTSPDLITWTPNTVGIWQNSKVVFSDDGRAVMGNLASVDPIMSRTINGEWQNVTSLPETDNFLRYRDIIFANNRFHVVMYEYSVVGEGDDKVVMYLNLYVGFSDDLIQWTWTSISTDENEILALAELTALADNQLAISGRDSGSSSADHMLYSVDNGATWNESANPIVALNISNTVDASKHNYNIGSLIDHDGTTYGKLTISGENNFKNETFFSTTDFTNFNFEFVSNNSELFSYNNALYLNAAVRNMSWHVYRKIESSEIQQRVAVQAAEESALAATAEAVTAATQAIEAAQAAADALVAAKEAAAAVQDASTDEEINAAIAAENEAQAKAVLAEETATQALANAQAAATIAEDAATIAGTDAANQAATQAAAAVASAVQSQEATQESATQTNQVVEDSQAAQLENNEKDSSSTGIGGVGFLDLFLIVLLAFGFKSRR